MVYSKCSMIWSTGNVALDRYLMPFMNYNFLMQIGGPEKGPCGTVLDLRLIQLFIVKQLQHWRLNGCCFYSNRGYSGSRSSPLITPSWMPTRSTCMCVVLATSLQVMRARCQSLLWLFHPVETRCFSRMWAFSASIVVNQTSQGLQCFILRWNSLACDGYVDERRTADNQSNTACWDWMNYWLVTNACIASKVTFLET